MIKKIEDNYWASGMDYTSHIYHDQYGVWKDINDMSGIEIRRVINNCRQYFNNIIYMS